MADSASWIDKYLGSRRRAGAGPGEVGDGLQRCGSRSWATAQAASLTPTIIGGEGLELRTDHRDGLVEAIVDAGVRSSIPP